MPKFFTNYSRPPQVGFSSKEPSKTLQQFKDEADINVLIARYAKTGFYYNPLVQGTAKRVPQFEDFSELGDFREQQQRILDVYRMFEGMPSKIREMFGHNPAAFVDFVGDPKNEAQCVKLGILKAREEVKEVVKPVVAEPVVEQSVKTEGITE